MVMEFIPGTGWIISMKDKERIFSAATDLTLMTGKGVLFESQYNLIMTKMKRWVKETRYYMTTPLQLSQDFMSANQFWYSKDGNLQITRRKLK